MSDRAIPRFQPRRTPIRLAASRPLVALSLAALPSLALPHLAHADDLEPYARAIDERPDDAKAYEAYATAAISAHRYDDAVARLKQGIARVAEWKRGFYLLAFAYRSKGAFVDAAGFYRVCVAVKQQENEAQFGLGKSLEGLGDNKGAIAAFRAYAESEKDPSKARFVEAARAEIEKLQPSTTTASAGGGGEAAAHKAEGDSAKAQGRLSDAVASYKKAIALDPRSQDLQNDLGNAYFAMKRYAEAAQAFRAATTLDPSFAVGWYNLANALRKADERPDAVEAYKRYMALQPNDPDPWFGMGQTLKGMGDSAGAANAFRRYLQMETRPEQQKWVDKAKAELQQLEGKSGQGNAPASGGKIGFD